MNSNFFFLPVHMPEISLGRDPIANESLQFGDFRKSALGFAGPDSLSVHTDLEDAAGSGFQGQFGDLFGKGGQKFLCYPGRAQQPVALTAVGDFNALFHYECELRLVYTPGLLRPPFQF